MRWCLFVGVQCINVHVYASRECACMYMLIPLLVVMLLYCPHSCKVPSMNEEKLLKFLNEVMSTCVVVFGCGFGEDLNYCFKTPSFHMLFRISTC